MALGLPSWNLVTITDLIIIEAKSIRVGSPVVDIVKAPRFKGVLLIIKILEVVRDERTLGGIIRQFLHFHIQICKEIERPITVRPLKTGNR